MSFFGKAPPLSFRSYILPSLPFRRKLSSDSTTSSSSADSDIWTSTTSARRASDNYDDPSPPRAGLPGRTSCIRCRACAAELCLTDQIVSRGFQGRNGRAYLVAPLDMTSDARAARLPNTYALREEPRPLVTGQHIVSDIRCSSCDAPLGWKYLHADEESQRYKVGKYILETKRVSTLNAWEMDQGAADGRLVGGKRLDDLMKPRIVEGEEIEFDSQDEDECEDLFLGQWTPELALKRRRAKVVMAKK